MSHERTVESLVREIEHVTGVKIRIRWMPSYGLYLEDTETWTIYPLSKAHKKEILTPYEQESVCRGLHREHWLVLFGLREDPD